jgi:putative zinc finger protein
MTSCADLDAFFDGELAKDAAANFREHLVDCRRCQVALRGRMQEETALEKWLERGAQHHPPGATPARTVRPVVVGNPEHDGIAGRAGDQVEQAPGEDGDPAAHRAVARELGGRRGGGRGRMLIFFAPVLAAAAAVAIWLVGTPGDPAMSPARSGAARPSSPAEFSLAIERRSAGMRSGAVAAGEAGDSVAQVGDVLRSMVRGEDHRAIWVYLEDRELVIACPDGPGCSSTGESLTLGLRVSAPGRYSIIEISSVQPIPTPQGPLDVMLSSIADVGAHFEIKRVDVN